MRGTSMRIPHIESMAITAQMAAFVGADTFNKLFAGVEFDEVDGDILFVYARCEDCAAEMEDAFGLHISIIAGDILKREIGVVMVLPRYRVEQQHHN
jgi:hypothetical protein